MIHEGYKESGCKKAPTNHPQQSYYRSDWCDHLHACLSKPLLARLVLVSVFLMLLYEPCMYVIEESSSTNDEVKPKPVPKTLLQTSMLQDYQTPQVIASLRNKTTRYGYKQHVIAKGAVPAMDNDMYRTPEFITSQYHQQFTHPNKR